jgi:KUP system potassium uptake protein
VDIEHTSETAIGQIYIPGLNWLLMAACIGLVLGFRSSSALAAAYGVAVTTDMVLTSVLFFVVARKRWKWGLPAAASLVTVFLIVDLSFWGASLIKIPSGGWFPLVIAVVVFTMMTTWSTGRAILAERIAERTIPMETLLAELRTKPPIKVPGTAIYMARNAVMVPHALLQNLRHNGIIHERMIVLALATEATARVPDAERVELQEIAPGIHRVVGKFGFVEDPDVPCLLDLLATAGLVVDPATSSFFLGRETLFATDRPGMAIWRERLFTVLARNARRATSYFKLPRERVCEIGAEIEL